MTRRREESIYILSTKLKTKGYFFSRSFIACFILFPWVRASGLRYRRVGGCGLYLGAEKIRSQETIEKSPQNPQQPVQALAICVTQNLIL